MKRLVRNLFLSAAVAATALAAVPAAHADSNRVKLSRTDKMVGIGVLGLTAGLLVGTLASQAGNQYRNPRPRPHQDRNYFPQAPVETGYPAYHGYAGESGYDNRGPRNVRNERARPYEPWSAEWYRWCDNRYRSFNANTGTFTTYGGEQRFCVVQ